MTKKCSHCKRVKDIEAFYYGEKYKDNYKNQCKECENKIAMILYYKRRGSKKCKDCGEILKDSKQLCDYCRDRRKKEYCKSYLKKKYSDIKFRKKEALRKRKWYLKQKLNRKEQKRC